MIQEFNHYLNTPLFIERRKEYFFRLKQKCIMEDVLASSNVVNITFHLNSWLNKWPANLVNLMGDQPGSIFMLVMTN